MARRTIKTAIMVAVLGLTLLSGSVFACLIPLMQPPHHSPCPTVIGCEALNTKAAPERYCDLSIQTAIASIPSLKKLIPDGLTPTADLGVSPFLDQPAPLVERITFDFAPSLLRYPSPERYLLNATLLL